VTPCALITRALPGAEETAAAVAARGWRPILAPLFHLEKIAAEPPAFDALAFTSANGVRFFAAGSSERDKPVYCVGGRTAAEARRLGFRTVMSADGDVGDLEALILSRLPKGQRLLHAGNREGAGDLCGALVRQGLEARFIATYAAIAAPAAPPPLAAMLAGEIRIDVILIHSAKAARILAAFAGPSATLTIAAISKAAAAPLSSANRRIAIARRPSEGALLDAMEALQGA
jgi:uroporphyrinogen-III synthase